MKTMSELGVAVCISAGAAILAGCGSGGASQVTPMTQSTTLGLPVHASVRAGKERVLFSFGCYISGTCPVGPEAGLLAGSGSTFFGTTVSGFGGDRNGTVFKLTHQGSAYQLTILYVFRGDPDGQYPDTALISNAAGDLYGTTETGGTSDAGTVFRLTPNGSGYDETVLYSFLVNGSDAYAPSSPLIEDKNGVFYGETGGGGTLGGGTVYRMTPKGSGYTETVLNSFPETSYEGCHCGDPSDPRGGLIEDKNGALYGTTVYGGSYGLGSVFRLTPHGSGYKEVDLYSFTGGADGGQPYDSLVADSTGALYGTTWEGGVRGYGDVFKLTPKRSGYVESVLHSFQGVSDGQNPLGGLMRSKDGVLFGTTSGGSVQGCYHYRACGTVFKLSPSGPTYTEHVLYVFHYYDGGYPMGNLITRTGTLYGTTATGGYCGGGCGTAFSVKP